MVWFDGAEGRSLGAFRKFRSLGLSRNLLFPGEPLQELKPLRAVCRTTAGAIE